MSLKSATHSDYNHHRGAYVQDEQYAVHVLVPVPEENFGPPTGNIKPLHSQPIRNIDEHMQETILPSRISRVMMALLLRAIRDNLIQVRTSISRSVKIDVRRVNQETMIGRVSSYERMCEIEHTT